MKKFVYSNYLTYVYTTNLTTYEERHFKLLTTVMFRDQKIEDYFIIIYIFYYSGEWRRRVPCLSWRGHLGQVGGAGGPRPRQGYLQHRGREVRPFLGELEPRSIEALP